MNKPILLLCLPLLLTFAPSAFGQLPPILPDSHDSVIVESKFVYAGVGSPRAVVKVYITNKDTLAAYVISLVQSALPLGAYMTLSYPRSFSGAVNPLTSTLQFQNAFAGHRFNSSSPDTLVIAGFRDPNNVGTTAEPPNLTRKALFEIKFDSVTLGLVPPPLDTLFNTITFDSALVVRGIRVNSTGFLDLSGNKVKVNFVKGRIRVLPPDLTPPSVTVTDPNGGESVPRPCPYTVTWNASDNVEVAGIEIRLDRNNDGDFGEQIANLSGNPGSYSWTPGGATSSAAKIKVIATDGAGNSTADVSNGTFSIITNCFEEPEDGLDLNEDGVLSLMDAVLLIKAVQTKSDRNSGSLSKAYIDSVLTAIFSGSP